MIKDIFKSVLRSFSRIIGKILAYILIGFLLALLFGKADVFAATSKTFATGFNGNTTLFDTANQTNPYSGHYWINSKITRVEYKNSSVELKKDYYVNASMNFKLDFISYSLDGMDLSIPNGNIILTHSVWLYNSIGEKRLSDDFCSFTYDYVTAGYLEDMSYHYALTGSFECKSFKVPETGYLELVTHISFSGLGGTGYGYLDLNFSNYNITTSVDQESLNQSVINNQNNNTNKVINNQNQNQQQTNEKLDEVNKTNKSILDTIKNIFSSIYNLPQNIWNLLKGGFEMIGGFISDLLDSIKGIFLPEPICEISPNLFPGFTISSSNSYNLDINISDDNSLYFLSNYTGMRGYVTLFDGSLVLSAGTYTFINKSEFNRSFWIETSLSNFSFDSLNPYTITFNEDVTINKIKIYLQSKEEFYENYHISFMIVDSNNSYVDYSKYGSEFCEKTSFWTWFQRLGNMIGQFFINLLNGIKSLFLPDNFDFLNGFLEALQSKLGFIASIPIQLIQFLVELPNFVFKEVTSLTLPKIEILGVSWWDTQEIDFTEILNVLKPFKYFTDLTAVVLFVDGLMKYYDGFANGGK